MDWVIGFEEENDVLGACLEEGKGFFGDGGGLFFSVLEFTIVG